MEKIIKLRQKLHNNPEPSMQEIRTKEILMAFLAKETKLEIVDRGKWFYAFKKGRTGEAAIAFRADFDAVVCEADTTGNPGENRSGSADMRVAKHLCGHDGHSAVLAGFALALDGTCPKRDTYLIFQPGEETGEGARICAELIREKKIAEIYGFHNIPGAEMNTVILANNTFACASTGMEIILTGRESHAAHPEQGNNPARAVAEILPRIDEIIDAPHEGILLSTVIGIDLGSSSYGVSAGKGTLRLTVRTERQDEFDRLACSVEEVVERVCAQYGLTRSIKRIEEFPATVNHTECVRKVENAAKMLGLKSVYPDEPFRWSEDFGHYLKECKGAFFGVGCGENHAGLHTSEYEFEDKIIETVINIYKNLAGI